MLPAWRPVLTGRGTLARLVGTWPREPGLPPMSDRSPARASGAGRGVLGGREVTAGSVAPALWGTLHFALASQSVPPLPLGRPGNGGGGDTWRMPATRAWRSGVFWRHRTPGPGSCRRQKETDLDRWAAPSAVACAARSAQGPLPAGAGRRGLIRRPGPPVESPRPPAQSPLLRPASRGPFSTQVTSGLPLSPSASPGLRAPRPGCPSAAQSLSKKTWTPRWTAFLWEQLGALQEGGPGQALDYPVLTDGRRALMSQA